MSTKHLVLQPCKNLSESESVSAIQRCGYIEGAVIPTMAIREVTVGYSHKPRKDLATSYNTVFTLVLCVHISKQCTPKYYFKT